MNFRKVALLAILIALCVLQQGFGTEQKQQVTVLKYVVPHYPAVARTARIQGDVVLSFNVLSDGRVADIKVVSGPKILPNILIDPSVDAIKQWKFQCLSCGYGKPFHHQFTFSFQFDEKLGERDHSIKYDLPDKLTISTGEMTLQPDSQVSSAI